ncbi:MAG TPA: fatty acid desaturase [Rhizomicrobium sp.]|nr:fatty acid desaturase [Rhizomicrobium sp.]
MDAAPTRVNALLFAVAALAAAVQFVAFPLLVAVTPEGVAALLLAAAASAPLSWGLMHESIHAKLFESERMNQLAGRLAGLMLCLNWDVMRFGHLMHHRANRHDLDRPEDLGDGQSRLSAAPGYYFTLLGGGTLKAALAPIAVFLPAAATERIIAGLFGESTPQLRDVAVRAFTDPERRARMRMDFVATLALVAASALLWGVWWPVLGACILVRFAMLSILDNAPHYGTAKDSGNWAYNTTMPRAFRWLVLNGNFHGVHHHAPQLSWRELPTTFAEKKWRFEGSWLAMVLRQFRGPVRID